MDLDEARLQAKSLFGDVGPPTRSLLVEVGRREGSGKGFLEQLETMTPKGFPLPGLLLFGLTQLLDLSDDGPGEKVRWTVRFALRGATFGFELRKFGLRMLCEPANLDTPITKEVLGKARALTNIVEQYLSESYILAQIKAGNVTMANLYSRLDERYRFLREQAEVAYARPPPPPETGESEFTTWYHQDLGRPDREGGALATAAVDAYFSRIDHLFCLAAAFRSGPLPCASIVEFLGSNWPSKARAILNLQLPAAKTFYDKLVNVREEWRNPLAHGGFLSGGGSLYFHLPNVCALPARLRRTPNGVKLGFILEGTSFSDIVHLFDSFDAFLKRRTASLSY
jgi:hypothetical protein